MTKQEYLKPDKEDFYKGNILTIYSDVENEENPVGKARLIEPMEFSLFDVEYIREEIGGSDKQNPHTIVWTKERWKIEFIDGPSKGFITARYIARFDRFDSIFK